jgi:hypothetical protein
MMCCDDKMTKYEQPPRFGQTFIFWKCKKCGKMLREEIEGGRVETGREDRVQDKQDS